MGTQTAAENAEVGLQDQRLATGKTETIYRLKFTVAMVPIRSGSIRKMN